jgi:hypothetical protein
MTQIGLPGFTAEASLHGGRSGYVGSLLRRIEQNIYPADYVDYVCVDACKQNCGSACADTAGQAKSACIRECARDNKACELSCIRRGDPPTPPPPPPPPPTWQGVNGDVLCVVEYVTHPVGSITNRFVIGELAKAGVITSLDECYNIATQKESIGVAIAKAIADDFEAASLIALVATFNIGTLTRCVCDEFRW